MLLRGEAREVVYHGPGRVIYLAEHELLLRNIVHAQTSMHAMHCLIQAVNI